MPDHVSQCDAANLVDDDYDTGATYNSDEIYRSVGVGFPSPVSVAGVVMVEEDCDNGLSGNDIELWISDDGLAWTQVDWARGLMVHCGDPFPDPGAFIDDDGDGYTENDGDCDGLVDEFLTVIEVNPGDSIQAAIEAAASYTVIEVAPGTYDGGHNFHGKDLVLVSLGDSSDTTIQGEEVGISFSGGETESSEVQGFAITGATRRGLYIDNEVGPSGLGGALFLYNYAELECACRLRANRVWRGGALYITDHSKVLLSGSVLEENEALEQGGPSTAGITRTSRRSTWSSIRALLITLTRTSRSLLIKQGGSTDHTGTKGGEQVTLWDATHRVRIWVEGRWGLGFRGIESPGGGELDFEIRGQVLVPGSQLWSMFTPSHKLRGRRHPGRRLSRSRCKHSRAGTAHSRRSIRWGAPDADRVVE